MSDIFPIVEGCLLCEGVRNEPGNKLTVFGLFGLTPIEIFVANLSTPVTLCFVFLCEGEISQSTPASLKIYNPDGTVLAEHQFNVNVKVVRKKKFMFAVTATLSMEQQGDYSLELLANREAKTKVSFSVKQGTPPAVTPPKTFTT